MSDQAFTYEHKVKCSGCNGAGHEDGSTSKQCSTCKGKGRVFNRVDTIFGVVQQEAICSTCDGVGKIYDKICKGCSGKGFETKKETIEVEIPEGVDTGNRVKVAGKGQAGYRGSEPGDLFLNISIKPHDKLKKEGLDVHSSVSVSYFDLLIGTKIDVYTVWGEVEVNVPPSIADLLNKTEADKTPLQKQLDRLVVIIASLAGITFVLMLILGLAQGQAFDVIFLAGIALAISAIPTGMPAVVTTIYSMGTRVLGAQNAIVKRLPSVETLGSVSAICSDKTGTLTLHKMRQ